MFCLKKLSKKHLCYELYVYTLLFPIFNRVVKYGNGTHVNLRKDTLRFINSRELFKGLDVYDMIMKYSIYFIIDFETQ